MGFFARELTAPAAPAGPSIEWEETDCLLCGGRNAAPLVEAPDLAPGGAGLWFSVMQCQDCGLCFTNPRPSERTIGQFYSDDYRPHRLARPGRRPWWRWRPWRRPCPEQRVLPWHGRGRLLDFGCGGGHFLARMHEAGWDVTGLDVSPAAVERIRHHLGLRAVAGSLPHSDLAPASYDVITMWHALEHVHSPAAVLREAHRLLAPGGQLRVAVPNIDSLPFRWFGQAWYGLDLPRHLTHFAPTTLHVMLERAGFRVQPIRMVRHSGWLRNSARLARRLERRGPTWRRCLIRKPPALIASWYCYLTQQADCILAVAVKAD
jgi:SAM-dependent methyltransferase